MEYKDAYQYVVEHGKRIGQEAKNGHTAARDIIGYYKMHFDCPGDPGAKMFFTKAVAQYIQMYHAVSDQEDARV